MPSINSDKLLEKIRKHTTESHARELFIRNRNVQFEIRTVHNTLKVIQNIRH